MTSTTRLALILLAGSALSACTTPWQGGDASLTESRGIAPSPYSPAPSPPLSSGPMTPFGDPLVMSMGMLPEPAAAPAPRADGTSFSAYRDAFTTATATPGRDQGTPASLAQVSFSLEGSDFDPDVSRDGTMIVFASTQHRPSPDIYIKPVDGRVITQLTSDPAADVMPRLSPDGTRVAFASNRAGNWDIYIMPITGGKAVQVTSSASDELHPSWSPDGSQLVYSRLGEMSGQWEIWVTDVGNSGISRFIGYGLFPEWCPVSGTGTAGADRIAFQKSRERGDRAFAIWTIDYQGGQAGNTTEIASSPIAACINPAWSKDGQWLAFATVPNPGAWNSEGTRPSSAQLWMVDLSGTNRINLTSDNAVNLMPAWGARNRLFFVSDRSGVDNIWCMDTTPMVQLAQINAGGRSASAKAPPNPERSRPSGQDNAVVNVPDQEPAPH
jgi:TolB protein